MDLDLTESGLALPRRELVLGLGGVAAGTLLADPALASHRGTSSGGSSGSGAYGGRFIGVHLSAGGVGNTTYKMGVPHAYRFRAEKSGTVTRIRWWNRFNIGDSGYSSGGGGRIRIEIQTDSGGNPSGNVIGKSSDMAGISIGRFPLVTLRDTASLNSGQVYHIVFVQLMSSGFTSVNDLHSFAPSSPRSVFWGDTLASLTRRTGRWVPRADRQPIFELHYSDGSVKGQGYMNAGRSDAKYVSGSSQQVRQMIRIPSSRTTSQVSFRAWKTSSSGGLNIYLESPSGDRLARAYASASEISTSSGDRSGAATIRWVTKSWDRSVSLSSGSTYRVRFEASGGTYGFIALQKGWAWGFREDKMLPRGVTTAGQYSTNGGRSWSGWTMYGRGNRDDLDLPVLLTTS